MSAIECRHRGCLAVFGTADNHVAFTRIAAKRAGWGYTFQINIKTYNTRPLDYCPDHVEDAVVRK